MTSLCMVLHYFGITGETPDELMERFFEAGDSEFRKRADGHDMMGYGDQLKEFLRRPPYSLPASYIAHHADHNGTGMTLADIQQEIARGYPVWISYGMTSDEGNLGHIAVVRGFTENGDVIVNDPWGDPVTNRGGLRIRGNGRIRGAFDITSYLPSGHSPGLGSGDNSVISRAAMEEVCGSGALNQTLVVRYPHQWSFPVREHPGEEGAPWRFSAPEDGADLTDRNSRIGEINRVREGRIAGMLSKERLEGGGYPITGNGRWHDGIHIEKRAGTPVYAVGPGRLIAARAAENPETAETRRNHDGFLPSTCFALARHPVTVDGSPAWFFSHYMHLKPVTAEELASRIRARFDFGTPFPTDDWIDQLIRHVHGKAATVRPVNEPDNKPTGIMDGTMPWLYAAGAPGVIERTDEQLGTREIVYLCPTDDALIEGLRTVGGDSSGDGDLFDKLDSMNSYRTGDYYCIFSRKKDSDPGLMAWERRYVRATTVNTKTGLSGSDFLPLGMNREEFTYWRGKLAALLRGEAATFNDEDSDIRIRTADSREDRNADYHLEVNGGTKLGTVGSGSRDVLHFGTFSENNIVSGRTDSSTGLEFIPVEDGKPDRFFDRGHTLALLRRFGVLREEHFGNDYERRNFRLGVLAGDGYRSLYVREDARSILQHTVCKHLNSYAVQDDAAWAAMMGNASGTHEYDEEYFRKTYRIFRFIDHATMRAMRLEFTNSTVASWFYHPVRFLAWLDAEYLERAI